MRYFGYRVVSTCLWSRRYFRQKYLHQILKAIVNNLVVLVFLSTSLRDDFKCGCFVMNNGKDALPADYLLPPVAGGNRWLSLQSIISNGRGAFCSDRQPKYGDQAALIRECSISGITQCICLANIWLCRYALPSTGSCCCHAWYATGDLDAHNVNFAHCLVLAVTGRRYAAFIFISLPAISLFITALYLLPAVDYDAGSSL